MISGHNFDHVLGVGRNLYLIVGKSVTMQGFIVHRLAEKYQEEFYATMPQRVASGEIKYLEQIFNGLEKAGDAVIAVQMGTNTEKAVTHVADE